MTTLDDLRIVAPCGQDWAQMAGDERRRHCAHCDKHVHDLSACTRTQAQALLARGGDLCVRVRPDAAGRVRFVGEVLGALAVAATAMAGTPTHRDDALDLVEEPSRPPDVRGPLPEPAPDPMQPWLEAISRAVPVAALDGVIRCMGIESVQSYATMGAMVARTVGVPDRLPAAPLPATWKKALPAEPSGTPSRRSMRASRRAKRLARKAARKAKREDRRQARRAKWRAQRLARKRARQDRRAARRDRRAAKCRVRHRSWCRG